MPCVVVFAPAAAGRDDPLSETRWIADRTSEVLRREGFEVEEIVGEDAHRDELESVVARSGPAGVGFFAHGRRIAIDAFGELRDPSEMPATTMDCVVGIDEEPAFDRGNAHILRERWGHAVACSLGVELAGDAVDAGATCFAAYEVPLRVDWFHDEIPDELHDTVIELVTSTTCLLAQGERDESVLRRTVTTHQDSILDWLDDHEEASSDLAVFAGQLARVVVRVSNLR